MINLMEALVLAIAIIAAATAIGIFLDGVEEGYRASPRVMWLTAAKRLAYIACASALCIIAFTAWLWMSVS
jgi:hypothetical protein